MSIPANNPARLLQLREAFERALPLVRSILRHAQAGST
jgi:hypothetical protein